MMKRLWIAVVVGMLLLSFPMEARGRSGGGARRSGVSSRPRATRKAAGVRRDRRGRIARSSKARTSFRKSHPCPVTGKSTGKCPGYVIDHIVPLKRGGADQPGNMQWQPAQAAKAKDRVE